ncbi:galactose-specific lectin nattectin-like isoform X1 [Oreochromis niloticus]|uniref:galactose-specific lectin nattectin-like isoform X1 n=1 Tax=Oreochromis niloticus TaxID=8128 RepID=UPI000904B9F6|nr:galactose-specific lectin nattectin-like isoform X1 [Oreochromis niloticus]
MKMFPVCVFVCAVMILTHAAGEYFLPEGRTATNQTVKRHLAKRSSDCPGGWTLLRGRCFLYVPGPMTWAKAEKNCLSMGANLASVHSITEYHGIQHMIMTATHGNQETWIGGSDAQEENAWLWTDGTAFHYSNWCPGEPNNYGRNQHCLQINHSGSKCWDDKGCHEHRPSVCVKKI